MEGKSAFVEREEDEALSLGHAGFAAPTEHPVESCRSIPETQNAHQRLRSDVKIGGGRGVLSKV